MQFFLIFIYAHIKNVRTCFALSSPFVHFCVLFLLLKICVHRGKSGKITSERERKKHGQTTTFISFIMTQASFMVFTTRETVVLFCMHLKISIRNLFEYFFLPLFVSCFFHLCSIENSNSSGSLSRKYFTIFLCFVTSIALNMQLKCKQLVDHLQLEYFPSFIALQVYFFRFFFFVEQIQFISMCSNSCYLVIWIEFHTSCPLLISMIFLLFSFF